MNKTSSLTAIVLTYNESMHLNRCLSSLQKVCSEIVVVDSFSTDATQEIAERYGARFYENKWVNYAAQFNWGIENPAITTDWVIRVDADEYLSDELIDSIKNKIELNYS